MTISVLKKDDNEERLERFFDAQKKDAIGYLLSNFSFDYYQCEDIFQEAIITLWEKVNEGKVSGDMLELSNSAYLHKICKNKALKKLSEEGNHKGISISDDDAVVNIISKKISKLLDYDSEYEEQKEDTIRGIIRDLPSPCDEILWGYYGNGESLKSMADELYHGSVSSVRVTKHRCLNKFSKRYLELVDRFNQEWK